MKRFWVGTKKKLQRGRASTRVIDLRTAQPGGDDAMTVVGLRVLLIDENEGTRELLAGTLKHYGAQVTAVASAEAARELLESVRPQVLVSNCVIEPAEASALLRAVRVMEAERNHRIPTVAVTGYAKTKHVFAHLVTGFQIHASLAQPRDLVVLLGRVAAVAPSR